MAQDAAHRSGPIRMNMRYDQLMSGVPANLNRLQASFVRLQPLTFPRRSSRILGSEREHRSPTYLVELECPSRCHNARPKTRRTKTRASVNARLMILHTGQDHLLLPPKATEGWYHGPAYPSMEERMDGMAQDPGSSRLRASASDGTPPTRALCQAVQA